MDILTWEVVGIEIILGGNLKWPLGELQLFDVVVSVLISGCFWLGIALSLKLQKYK